MMPMDNNMPPLVQGEEDCGCGGESRLYSPQPGGPQYANPLYYQPTQSAYAPQPGTMYYQPDPKCIWRARFRRRGRRRSLKGGSIPAFCSPVN